MAGQADQRLEGRLNLLALLFVFILACPAGYYAVQVAGEGAMTPVKAMSCATGSIILIGALIVVAETSDDLARYCGIAAILLASVSTVGGFLLAKQSVARMKDGDR